MSTKVSAGEVGRNMDSAASWDADTARQVRDKV